MRHNVELVNKGKEPIRNRNQPLNKKGKGQTVWCKGCKRFLLSTSAIKHKQKCQSENQSDMKPKSGNLKPDNNDINQKFHRNILSHIRTNNDPVGTLATSDHGIILLIGKNLYRGTDDQKRSNITNPMRLLARLLLICRQIEGNNEFSLEDIC